MTTFAKIESRRRVAEIRREAIRQTFDFLVRNVSRKGQIEARVLALALAMRCESLDITTQKELAERLGFSKQRASAVVDSMVQKLTEIATDYGRAVDSGGNTTAPGDNLDL